MSPDETIDAAEAAFLAGDVERAHELLEAARRSAPATARLLGDLGVVHAARGDVGAARAFLERALALDPSSADARANLEALPARSHHAPRESVIVPAYGRPDATRRLLEALGRQSVALDEIEVIVVDDGSPAPLEDALADLEVGFALDVVRQENAGPGAARNHGLRRAAGDVVLFLNDDAVPDPGLVAAHRRARERAPEHAAILGAFPYSETARTSRFVRLVEENDLVFPFGELRSDRPNDWIFFWTCNVSVLRRDVEAVGGFDERFVHAMAEDIELGWRMQRDLGTVVVHAPDAVCEHEHRLTAAEYARRQYTMGWNHHLLFEKYGNPAPLGVGGLGPFDDRAFTVLRREVEAEGAVHDRALAELEAWERADAGAAAEADVERAHALATRLAATAFKRGICERHFHPDAGRVFHPREKDFLTGGEVQAPAAAAGRRAVFVQVPC